ncbi:hypothetical protein CEXT_213071 [Caerostris extrusa]|uniref:NAD(P)H oxidase (H2O2-forming) n=1 Tax=Caerostris extrusa TaxID=172846 RepID=A0AAV4V8L6_CAEEX|nr:hypothetical protein CEXT_213071 [Caerostris extrusa]
MALQNLPDKIWQPLIFKEVEIMVFPDTERRENFFRHIIEKVLPDFYSSVDDVDLFVGGLLEANEGLGPVFKEIVKEQFKRIRDGDRFWFQNTKNGFFTKNQTIKIKDTHMYDIILTVTQNINMDPDALQPDVFHASVVCLSHLNHYQCKPYGIETKCYALPTVADERSGAAYALSFLFLFLFIIGCVIALFILVKMRKKAILNLRQSVKQQRKNFSDENSCIGTEWMGRREGTRDVIINFLTEKKLLTISLLNKQMLRSIDLKHVQVVEVHVLKFEIPEEKEIFIEKLETFLGRIGIGRQRYESSATQMLKSAITKAHRQKQLEKFFRVVFAQAFSIEHDRNELSDIDYVPDLIDADANGYISFREFLNVIVIFAKGSPEDKTKLMFDMYDIDHSGKLSRLEFSDMIRSLLELANQSLSPSQLDDLIASMFTSAGLQQKQEITFSDFTHILADHREELGYVQLSFNIGDGFKTTTAQMSRKSMAFRAEETVLRAYSVVGAENLTTPKKPETYLRVETKPNLYEKDPTKQKVNKIIRFIENYRPHIFWTTLYTLVILGIFIDKAYYYSVEAEHNGLRRIAGYGVTVTRGAASAMINNISQVYCILGSFFSLFHIIGHAINFYHVGTQTVSDLQCLFPNFHLNSQNPPRFPYWLIQTITGITVAKVEIPVVKAELLPSGVTHLEFKRPNNFEYKSGQWIRIACLPLNANEFHPFTISSAPHEENLSLHIRAVGPWTTNLRKIYDPNNLQRHALPKIYLDGPYGEGHQDWFRYDVSVLVGGIGITPFASILKDIVFKSSLKHKIFCKKLYFIW